MHTANDGLPSCLLLQSRSFSLLSLSGVPPLVFQSSFSSDRSISPSSFARSLLRFLSSPLFAYFAPIIRSLPVSFCFRFLFFSLSFVSHSPHTHSFWHLSHSISPFNASLSCYLSSAPPQIVISLSCHSCTPFFFSNKT